MSVPQNDFKIRAAFAHSMSSVDGQKASRCTLPPLAKPLAAATLIRARVLLGAVMALLLLLLELWLRPAQPNKPLGRGAAELAVELAAELEFLLSHEGSNPETRCMAGDKAPLCRRRRRSGEDTTERIESKGRRGGPAKQPDMQRCCPSRRWAMPMVTEGKGIWRLGIRGWRRRPGALLVAWCQQ